MATQRDEWKWENTGGGVMRWTLGGFVIGGPAGADPVEGKPCFVSHFANGHEHAVSFPSPEAAREAVATAMVEVSDEDDPCWVAYPLTEWMAANEEDSDCADAAMRVLRDPNDVVWLGGGAAPYACVRRSRVEG